MNIFFKISVVPFLFFTQIAHGQERVSLQAYLSQVKAHNLDLKVEAARSASSDAQTIGLNIPPPMAGFTRMKPDESSDPAYGFEVSQSLPFPSKISGNHTTRSLAFRAQRESELAVRSEVLSNAKIIYVSLWSAQEKIKLLAQKKAVIETHTKMARSIARSDSLASIHVLKAESDLDFLETEIISAEQNLMQKQAEFLEVINRDPSGNTVKVEEPELSPTPKAPSIIESHQLRAQELGLEGLRSLESEASSAWYPDFNLRYKQNISSGQKWRNSEIMLAATLPFVFFWQTNRATSAARADRQRGEFELSRKKQATTTELFVLFSRLQSQKKQLDILSHKLIPRAEKRLKILHNLAPRDMETLNDHRDTMQAFPDLQLQALAVRLEYEKSVASLEKYIPNIGGIRE